MNDPTSTCRYSSSNATSAMKQAALSQPSTQSHRGPLRGAGRRSAWAAASAATTPKSTPENRSMLPRS